MAFRTDVSVDWSTSPRIITVAAPSTEITIQDLVDTCRELEQQSHNMTYARLISAAGKESLGGGVLVGITATLQNAVVAFEVRTVSDSSGTATSADATGEILIDNVATFISDGIIAGDTILNTTDLSMTSIVEVVSETEIRHYPLADGTDDDWDISDSYKIWNKIQCEVTGGNLVALDSVGSEISPILPTAQTHIVRTSSSSATLQEQQEVQFASFEGAVHIDVGSGISGTAYPKGTARQPVDNLADALVIAAARGLQRLLFESDYTFLSGDSVNLYEIEGRSPVGTTLTFNSGSTCIGSEFYNCTVEGTMVSPQSFVNCEFNNITGNTIGIAGIILVKECAFLGTITLSNLLEGEIHLVNCYSGTPGSVNPIFDVNGADVNILARNYSGGMEIRNFTHVSGKEMSLDFVAGEAIIADTCTTGTIILRGVGDWTNKATYAGTTVVTDKLISQNLVEYASFEGSVHIDVGSGFSGTAFPRGTAAAPVDNLADALTIATARGFNKLLFESDYTFVSGNSVNLFEVCGTSVSGVTLTFDAGSTCVGTQFFNCTVEGTMVSPRAFDHCQFLNVTGATIGLAGTILIENSGFLGTVTLSNALEGAIHLMNCHSGIPGTVTPVFDANGADVDVLARGYNGGMELRNFSNVAANVMSLDFASGSINIADTCTTGAITLRGVGNWLNQDTYAGTTTINNLFFNGLNIADAVWDEPVADHQTADTFGEYMDTILAKVNAVLGLS